MSLPAIGNPTKLASLTPEVADPCHGVYRLNMLAWHMCRNVQKPISSFLLVLIQISCASYLYRWHDGKVKHVHLRRPYTQSL